MVLSGGAAIWITLTGRGLSSYLAEETAAPAAGEKGDKEPSIFVKIEPMQLVVRSQQGRNYQVLLTLNLELVEASDKPKVEKMVPRLRDAFVRELYGIPMSAAGQWTAGDLESVKNRLRAQSNRVLGAELIASVLIQQAIPINR